MTEAHKLTELVTRLTDEQLREIVAGCEGVTPGPWLVHAGVYEVSQYCYVTDGKSNLAEDIDPTDAAHIARLDPQTVSSMASEVLSLTAELAEVRAALKPVVDALGVMERREGEALNGNRLLSQYGITVNEARTARALGEHQ